MCFGWSGFHWPCCAAGNPDFPDHADISEIIIISINLASVVSRLFRGWYQNGVRIRTVRQHFSDNY